MTCINFIIMFCGPANEGVLRMQGGLGFILGNDGILLRYIPGIMGSDA